MKVRTIVENICKDNTYLLDQFEILEIILAWEKDRKSRIPELICVFNGDKFIGFEFETGGRDYCIYLNQDSMPGIRVGKFLPELNKEFRKEYFKEIIQKDEMIRGIL